MVAFTSFGESAAAGTAIGLVYRGIVFWMPFIIGAVLINTTKAFKGDVKQAAYDQDMGAVAGTAATAARLQEEAHADAVRFKRAAALRSRMAGAAGAHATHGAQQAAGAVPEGSAAVASAAAQTVPFAEGAEPAPAADTVPFTDGHVPAPAAQTEPFAEGAGPERASVTVAPTADGVPPSHSVDAPAGGWAADLQDSLASPESNSDFEDR